MRAVSYAAYRQWPELVDLPDPVCPADGVLVRVAASGVCRSDWHAWQGHDPVPLPMVPGHEFAGEVAEVGARVRRWQVGERVVVPFACGCGQCPVCRAGDTHVCPEQTQPGFTGWGSFAELVAVHAADTNVVALPPGLDPVAAAALGCRYATAHRALVGVGRLADGEWLVVHGCGGVGLSAVQIGVALGARVIAVDVSAHALTRATELGAVGTLLLRRGPATLAPDEVAARLVEMTDGGPHLHLDAIGAPGALQAGVLALRPRGRHVQVGLLLGADASCAVPMSRVVARELAVLGAHGMPAGDYPGLLTLLDPARGAQALRPQQLIGRVIGLADAPAALAALGEPAAYPGLTVIDLQR
jgi:D-arabinose 1-dehydrogenase-like Zn-dependent alcohol dehydrogenase